MRLMRGDIMERYKIMKYNKIVLILQIDFLDFFFNFPFKKLLF